MTRAALTRIAALAARVTLTITSCSLVVSAAEPPARDSKPAANARKAAAKVAAPVPHTNPADKRPNIVLVMADDMRADELRFMPKTRKRLGAKGMTFTDALTPHPLCCPARAILQTGQYAQNNGVLTNWGPRGGYEAFNDHKTIATMLNVSGYNTAYLGKSLNGYTTSQGRAPGWTLFDPSMHGYSDYYGFKQYNNGHPVQYRKSVYFTDYLDAKGTEYAHILSRYDAPFFLWISQFGPHHTQADCGGDGCNQGPQKLSPKYRRLKRRTGGCRTRDQQVHLHEVLRRFRRAVRPAAGQVADPVGGREQELRQGRGGACASHPGAEDVQRSEVL